MMALVNRRTSVGFNIKPEPHWRKFIANEQKNGVDDADDALMTSVVWGSIVKSTLLVLFFQDAYRILGHLYHVYQAATAVFKGHYVTKNIQLSTPNVQLIEDQLATELTQIK